MQNTSCLFLCLVLAVTVLVPVSGVNCAVSVSGVGSNCAVPVSGVGRIWAEWSVSLEV